jgi:hypothetical protein
VLLRSRPSIRRFAHLDILAFELAIDLSFSSELCGGYVFVPKAGQCPSLTRTLPNYSVEPRRMVAARFINAKV